MSGETEKDVSGWTTDTLKSYMLQIINERTQQMEQKWMDHAAVHNAEHREVLSAFEAAKEKAASHNDLINAGERKAETFLGKAEYTSAHQALIDKIDTVERHLPALLGRAEYQVAHVALDDKIDGLTLRVSVNEAAVKGSRELTSRVYATLGAVGVLAAIVATIIAIVT